MNDPLLRAQQALSDNAHLRDFARARGLSEEAARAVLERMLREPEISEEAKAFLSAGTTSADVKAFNAGEEKGYKRGHEAGFAKGSSLGAIAALGLFGLIKLIRR